MQATNHAFAPCLDDWQPWTPQEVWSRLRHVDARWCIAAGWAIDLFLQGRPREHEDIEIAVPANEFAKINAALADCDLFVVAAALATPLEAASREMLGNSHQTWARDRVTGKWRLDIFREPSLEGRWVARRDSRIQLAYDELILFDPQGIPFACPEVVLLFKAKAVREKDQLDFDRVLPFMHEGRRKWLHDALKRVHPSHAWSEQLALLRST
ncbi:MAG: hypothetical protein H7255_05755 [Ramlibacter sp.]|nr:hypothetical protein [Ramlibacter sp.]